MQHEAEPGATGRARTALATSQSHEHINAFVKYHWDVFAVTQQQLAIAIVLGQFPTYEQTENGVLNFYFIECGNDNFSLEKF